jgi:hypothetical protein
VADDSWFMLKCFDDPVASGVPTLAIVKQSSLPNHFFVFAGSSLDGDDQHTCAVVVCDCDFSILVSVFGQFSKA